MKDKDEIKRLANEIQLKINEYWENYNEYIEELAKTKENYLLFSIDDLYVKTKCENDVLKNLSNKAKFKYYFNVKYE